MRFGPRTRERKVGRTLSALPGIVKRAARAVAGYTIVADRGGADMMARKPIAYVQVAWHTEITEHCKEAFVAELTKRGYQAGSVGGIYRHDFVAHAVLQGIMQTSLETEVPVLSAVLTPHHFHEHAVHADFFKQHMRTKGTELAEACVAIVDKLAGLEAASETSHGAH
jgi:6,7-dimethyl-8-ribityllumazine synthase